MKLMSRPQTQTLVRSSVHDQVLGLVPCHQLATSVCFAFLQLTTTGLLGSVDNVFITPIALIRSEKGVTPKNPREGY